MKSYVIYHRVKVNGHDCCIMRRRVSNVFLLFRIPIVLRQKRNMTVYKGFVSSYITTNTNTTFK